MSFHDEELYKEAKKLVINTQTASVSLLQRRLRLTYTRAARIMDMLEERKVIGEYRGSAPREVLIDLGAEKL